MLARFIVLFVCLSAVAQAKPNQGITPPNKKTINWMVHEIPPLLLLKSSDTVLEADDIEGPLAGLYKTLAKSMPEYEHRFLRLPLVRLTKLLKDNKQICSLVLLESKERQEYLVFGEEVSVGLPWGLITLKDLSPGKYSLSGAPYPEIDVAKTLDKSRFRLGFATGRYYGPQVMPLLAKSKSSYGLLSDGSVMKLLSMLEAKRLDGVLAVYLEMAEYERAHPEGPKMQFFRIKEAPDFTTLRVSCENSKWGRKTEKDISKVVREKNFKELSNNYLLSVLPPERRKEYQALYDSRFPRTPAATKPNATATTSETDK